MDHHIFYAMAIAFVGFCGAVAYAHVHAPKGAQVVCIEQHGKWIPSWTAEVRGTCDFSKTASK